MTDDEQPRADSQTSVGHRMGLAALLLSGSFFLSRLLGFLRDAIIAYTHGANDTTDAYYAAFTLPDWMSYFLAGGTLSITFIPLFSDYLTRGDEQKGWRMFSTIATTMGAFLLVFTVALEWLTPSLIPLVNPGFVDNPTQMALAIQMTRIVIPAQLAFYVGGMLQATLLVREVFWPAAVAPLIYNICIIAFGVLLAPFVGIRGFSIGVVVGAFLGQLLMPLWAARKHVHFRPRFDLHDKDLHTFVLLSLPLMIGVSLVTVDQWILRYFASTGADGAITWLNNARKMMMVLFALIGQAAGQAALPYLTRLYQEGKEDAMGELLARNLQRLGFLSLVAAAGLIVAAEPIIWLVFQRGEFSPADASHTSNLLVFFGFGLLAWVCQSMAVRGFYARKNTLTPMLIGTAVVVVSLPIYWGLYHEFGVEGLAAATSIGISLNALATVIVYRRQTHGLPLRGVAAGLGRGLLFAVACGGAAWGVRHLLAPYLSVASTPENIELLAAMATAFFGTAALLAAVVQPPELQVVWERLKNRLG